MGPTASLRFKLPEEESEFKDAQRGADYHAAAHDFGEWLHRLGKHGLPTDKAKELYEQIRKEFYETFEGLLE